MAAALDFRGGALGAAVNGGATGTALEVIGGATGTSSAWELFCGAATCIGVDTPMGLIVTRLLMGLEAAAGTGAAAATGAEVVCLRIGCGAPLLGFRSATGAGGEMIPLLVVMDLVSSTGGAWGTEEEEESEGGVDPPSGPAAAFAARNAAPGITAFEFLVGAALSSGCCAAPPNCLLCCCTSAATLNWRAWAVWAASFAERISRAACAWDDLDCEE